MPSLNWIGKEKIITHHADVPFRVLEHRYGLIVETLTALRQAEQGIR